MRGIWHKERRQLYLQSFPCHITEPRVYPGSSRDHSEDLTRGYMLIFVWRSLEGNNTAKKERGTGHRQADCLGQKSVNFFPKKPESKHKARGSGSHTISVTTNQLGRCHGKAAIGNKHTRLCPSKALFVETGSRFGLQVLVCQLQSKIAVFKGTFCSNEMLHRCSTQFCRHTGL